MYQGNIKVMHNSLVYTLLIVFSLILSFSLMYYADLLFLLKTLYAILKVSFICVIVNMTRSKCKLLQYMFLLLCFMYSLTFSIFTCNLATLNWGEWTYMYVRNQLFLNNLKSKINRKRWVRFITSIHWCPNGYTIAFYMHLSVQIPEQGQCIFSSHLLY
jgi:hypothetical protein